MDVPWAYEAWTPTAKYPLLDKPQRHEVEKFRKVLIIQAKNVLNFQYDPESYYGRAEALFVLQYPELAAADAYKALLLCELGLDRSEGSSDLGELVRIYHGMKYWWHSQESKLWDAELESTSATIAVQRTIHDRLLDIRKKSFATLIKALFSMRAVQDVINICKEALKRHPEDIQEKFQFTDYLRLSREWLKIIEESKKTTVENAAKKGVLKKYLVWGEVLSAIYPWVPVEMRTRNPETISAANDVLQSSSANLEIRNSAIGHATSSTQSFGIFAKRRIRALEQVLDATTFLGICGTPSTGYCYNCTLNLVVAKDITAFSCCPKMQFCSKKCLEVADANYHKVLCGKNFDDILEYEGKTRINLELRLYLRLLATLVQTGKHPLEVPFVRWMLPAPTGGRQGFSLDTNVIGPFRILLGLGADIFDPRYDSWILQTVWNRVLNNKIFNTDETPWTTSLNPMYSFLNHSCAPNLALLGLPESSSMKLCAARDIKKGEEVFTTYGASMAMSWVERQVMLEPWMGEGGCKCKECLKGA